MGGPAMTPAVGRARRQQILDTVAAELRSRAAAASAIRTTVWLSMMAPALRGPEGPRCNPLLYMGYGDISGPTWICDLRNGADAVWKRFEGRVRTSVRKAESDGVRVRYSTRPEDWQLLYELHQVAYRRLGVPSYPSAMFRLIFEQLIPAGVCQVIFAELDDAPIAAATFACYKQGAYYWQGFASDTGLQSNALTLLIWSSIRRLLEEKKAQWLDCGDAVLHGGGKMRQLSDYKRGFGGVAYPGFRGQINTCSRFQNRLIHLRGLITGRDG
jgi:hypothetical protein